MVNDREAITQPKRDEEIRQIAYLLWIDEGCPDGRQEEHWLQAESIWRTRQQPVEPDASLRPAAAAPRKKAAAPAKTKSRITKSKTNPSKEQSARGLKEP